MDMKLLSIFLGFVFVTKFSDAKCPAYFTSFNMACYYYGSLPVASVHQALESCVSLGGYLLNINAELEYSHTIGNIKDQRKAFDGYWTGGVYKNGYWMWQKVDNGLFVDTFMDPDASYSHWGPNEPSSAYPITERYTAIMVRGRGKPYHLYSETGSLETPRGMSYICEADWIE